LREIVCVLSHGLPFLKKRIALLAGDELNTAIARVEGCRTGEAKMTPGFNLHARYIIHTVGPRYNARYKTAAENALHSCYRVCVQLAKENRLKTVAFCIINSEKRGYPREEGAHIALRTLRRSMEHFKSDFERIVFCVENDADFELYRNLMRLYFPRNNDEYRLSCLKLPENCGNEWGETVIEERVIRVGALGFNSSDDDESDEEEVASSWLSPAEKAEKSALTTMTDVKEETVSRSIEDEEIEQRYLSYLKKVNLFKEYIHCSTHSFFLKRLKMSIFQNLKNWD